MIQGGAELAVGNRSVVGVFRLDIPLFFHPSMAFWAMMIPTTLDRVFRRGDGGHCPRLVGLGLGRGRLASCDRSL